MKNYFFHLFTIIIHNNLKKIKFTKIYDNKYYFLWYISNGMNDENPFLNNYFAEKIIFM